MGDPFRISTAAVWKKCEENRGPPSDTARPPTGDIRIGTRRAWDPAPDMAERRPDQGTGCQRAMDRVNEICGSDRHPMIVDMATTDDVTRGARSVFAKPCQASRIALWGSSPVDRVIANFFLGIMKPPCPPPSSSPPKQKRWSGWWRHRAPPYIWRMFSALRKYLLIPRLIRLSSAAPKDPLTAWDQYWGGNVRSTGATGDVLWDSGSAHELNGYLPTLKQLDPTLPIVDVGCGNGSFTRLLAQHFPHALGGLDYSANAVDRARQEAAGITTASFAVCDMTAPGAEEAVATALEAAGWAGGRKRVHPRCPARTGPQRPVRFGREPSARRRKPRWRFPGRDQLPWHACDYVRHLGATRNSIPAPLEGAIRGLPMPGRFGAVQRAKAFLTADWNLVEEGSASIETRPLSNPSSPGPYPWLLRIAPGTPSVAT